MAVSAKLQSVLSAAEIEGIAENVRTKIDDHLAVLQGLINDLKTENAEIVAVSEKQQFQFEKEMFESQSQLKESTETCFKLKGMITELEENLNSTQKELREIQQSYNAANLELQSLKRSDELLLQEKKQLAEQLEKRRADIEKLNGEMRNLLEQTTAANEEKHAAIARAEEAQIHESNLKHQVSRLEQEKILLEQQISDLSSELSQKNHEIHTLKKEKSTIVLELQSQLEHRVDEVYLLEKQVVTLKETSQEKDARIEALAEKIRSLNDTSRQTEEQFNLELNSQTKLVELYKKASEDNQNRVKELVSAFEQAQKVLQELSESRNEAEKNCELVESEYKLKVQELEREIAKLKEELNRANELCQGKIFSPENLESLFPTAAATSKVMHSGMTLTQMYSEYVKAQEEIQNLRNENLKVNDQLKQIIVEIEENTPVINQRMKDYHKSLETISCLRTQLANSLTDYEMLLSERNDAKRITGQLERENARLKTQVSDLSYQVQVLLKEIEEARGSFVKLGDPQRSEDVSSSDEVNADTVISRHLVTFRDIVELQTNNQKLLAVVRQLSEEQEEQEKKISDEKNAELEKDLQNALAQLEELQKNRLKQAELVESIVRQRDMYRVLLTHQGFSESLLGSPQGPSLLNASTISFPSSDAANSNTKAALQQLQSEMDSYKKEKAENERMLNEQLEKSRSEVSDLRIEQARLTSQLEYCEERVSILKSNMENYKKEAAFLREKNQKHTALVTQHQQTIQNLKHEILELHEKLAKSSVALENLKAEKEVLKNVEKRLLHEKESVAREQQQTSQVLANLKSLQNNLERIESESKRNMQYQIDKYEKENAILKAKLESANEDYRSAVAVWEKQNRDLQQKIDSEVEKNRKLHEDLVDAYSKFHAVNQELSVAKAAAGPSDGKTDKSSPPGSSTKAQAQIAAQLKSLKEHLHEVESRAKALQDQLDLARKSADHYSKMCYDLEVRVKEQDEINQQIKESMESTLKASNDSRKSLEQNLEELEKSNRNLIEENMKISQEKDAKIQELAAQVASLQKEIDSMKDTTENAAKTASQAREDCLTQKKLMEETQEKYERELVLHAADVQALTALKEEHQKCEEKISELTSLTRKSEGALTDHKTSWLEQEQGLLAEQESLKQRLNELESQNDNLLHQLELMGTQMKALQLKNLSDIPNEFPAIDLKDTEHLLQIIQFLKKEKEIVSTQYDSAQSENVRLKLKVEQLTSELSEMKNEVKDLQNTAQVNAVSNAQHSELLRKVEMLNLLTESNSLLRIEKDDLVKSKEELEAKVNALQVQIQPLNDTNKEMSSQLEILSTENEALRQEVKSWQSRTNQLLEQSHRIGPQEYKNLTRELEELKSQKGRLAEELHRKQTEVSQLNSNLISLKKDLDVLKAEQNKKIQDLQKLSVDNAEQQKTMLQVKKIGRKYKTQYDELKVAHDALVAKTKVSETMMQDQTLQEMQKKLQDGEKAIKDLREESDKQKENALKAKMEVEVVQKQALEKEEKARKLLAQARQRINQINSQKNSALKELEDVKSENTALKSASEEEGSRIAALKSQYDSRIAHLEADLKASRETSEYLKKQCDDLCQKMAQQQKQSSKPTAVGGIVERGSSSEPLTANIKPLSAPTQASGTSLRHTPHAASQSPRSTPTASIRPMAIGTVAAASSSQARMAAVLPTTAATSSMPSTSDEDGSGGGVATLTASPVPQATVQPTPATATVAPTTVAPSIIPSSHTPVISEVVPTPSSSVDSQPGQSSVEPVQSIHITSGTCVTAHATALVSPRVEGIDVVDTVTVEGPAPTASVIVSPPATQTQLVTPTVKRKKRDSIGSTDSPDSSSNTLKRVRMVSEGSQTNQQTVVATTLSMNVAVVPVATVVSRAKVEIPTSEVAPSVHVETRELPPPVSTSTVAVQPSTSRTEIVNKDEPGKPDSKDDDGDEDEIIDVEEKEGQNIDWEVQDDVKAEGEFEEVMEEEEESGEQMEDFEDDVQISVFPAHSGEDEDMGDDTVEDGDEMGEQPSEVPIEVITILDTGSDNQMEADSSSLQAPSSDQCMAPPASPMTQVTEPTDTISETVIGGLCQSVTSQARRTTHPPCFPIRQERLPSSSRQHLTPFTIQGQGPSFEEGDDSIVPSTPTLFVPRRTDGFAEAVSSPHVPPVRFLFSSSESSPTQQGLSQLASQGALGVDDTRMDLSQFDEGGGRTVPSTPLQVSPPDETSVSEVPEIIEETTVEQSTESTVPTIRIESVESLAPQGLEKGENVHISSTSERDQVPTSTPVLKSDSAMKLSVEEGKKSGESKDGIVSTTAVSEASNIASSSAADEPKEMKKETEAGETEPLIQGPPPQSVRKPIVWEEENSTSAATTSSTAATPMSSTSAASAPPPVVQFSPPSVGGESVNRATRSRRLRYRGGGNFPRVMGAWPQRRSRGSARRSRMF